MTNEGRKRNFRPSSQSQWRSALATTDFTFVLRPATDANSHARRRPASLDEVPDDGDHGDDEQYMDESPHDGEDEESERPQYQQDDRDGKEHGAPVMRDSVIAPTV